MSAVSIIKSKKGYSGYRPDIMSVMQTDRYKCILDVGCGEGQFGVQIKQSYPDIKVYGVEGDKERADTARNLLEDCWLIDLNAPNWTDELQHIKFDLIIFADVLEHLSQPDRVLAQALQLLAADGQVITCIPNIRHWSTFFYLGVLGNWPANERGIFDKTHLRFFARKNILGLLASAHLCVIKEKRNVRLVEPWSWTNIPGKLLDWWPFRNFFTFQYIHLSERAAPDERQVSNAKG